MSFLCAARGVPAFQHRNNVGGMPVLLHHAATLADKFYAVGGTHPARALSPSVKYQTSWAQQPGQGLLHFASAGRSSRKLE